MSAKGVFYSCYDDLIPVCITGLKCRLCPMTEIENRKNKNMLNGPLAGLLITFALSGFNQNQGIHFG